MTVHDLIREATTCEHDAVGWLALHQAWRDMAPSLAPEETAALEASGARHVLMTMYTDVTVRGVQAFNACPQLAAEELRRLADMEDSLRSVGETADLLDRLAGNTNE